MRKILFLSVYFFCCLLTVNASVKKDVVDYVDPFICTEGDHGQWHPAALRPFGTVKLGPDTYPGSLISWGGAAHGGYNYQDTLIRGFSHFKKGGSGGNSVTDRAGFFTILPYTKERTPEWYRMPIVPIDKSRERASAGYYSTYLSEDSILVELTANIHSGYHRYTYAKGQEAKILIEQGNLIRTKGIGCRLVDDKTVEGNVDNFYFYIRFNHPVVKTFVKDENGFLSENKELKQKNKNGFVCSFGDLDGSPLFIQVGISVTDLESAKNNFLSECTNSNFDTVKSEARDNWNDILKKITVEGPDENLKTIFYTALYHSCFFPVSLTNVDGTYLGLDFQKHRVDGYVHYDGYAFWDSFRSKYTLFGLLVPEVYTDIVQSLFDLYQQTDFESCAPPKELNRKPHDYSYVIRSKKGTTWPNCRHEHMLMVMTDAYTKGFWGKLSLAEAYPYIRKELMTQMSEQYDNIGYIPEAPDKTCDYSWDSWCVAYLAKKLGKEDDYEYFTKRSNFWLNVWDPSIKFFRARATDGSWLDFPEDPSVNREKYTYEGTKWQFRWNSLNDVPKLIELFGGRKPFLKELNYFFDNNLYNAGNQIDLHVPFLFNMAGEPWGTQKWVHKILTEPILQRYGTHGFLSKPVFDKVYKSTPDGYLEEMDDDYGCMSSWFVMSAMGLFQVCPGIPIYQLFSPVFDKITLQLGNGNTLIIESEDLSATNYYIQSATLNGKPYNLSHISHELLMKGGIIHLKMARKPNKKWGVK